jgi:hypothetical protein
VSQTAAHAVVGDGHDGDFTQTAWGGDAEYSRDHYLLRFETIVSRWRLPIAAPPADQLALQTPLDALSTSVEDATNCGPTSTSRRATITWVSATSKASRRRPWDAPVTRFEIGGGYSLRRNLLLKGSFQHDSRDGGVLRGSRTCSRRSWCVVLIRNMTRTHRGRRTQSGRTLAIRLLLIFVSLVTLASSAPLADRGRAVGQHPRPCRAETARGGDRATAGRRGSGHASRS